MMTGWAGADSDYLRKLQSVQSVSQFDQPSSVLIAKILFTKYEYL